MAQMGMPNQYLRLSAQPLEANTLFMNIEGGQTGYEQAMDYVQNKATAYVGQILTAQAADGTLSTYRIEPGKLLKRFMDFVETTFEVTNLVDGALKVFNNGAVPKGIKNPNGEYFPVAPDSLGIDGFYSIDLTGLTITGTWTVVF